MRNSDTIAKYYKVKGSSHFYYCSIDYSPEYTFETHLILELNQAGEVLQSARFFHGNYSCCWDNCYGGFNRYGEFLGLKTCATGSGFCASNLYLFKTMAQQQEQRPIPLGYWEAIGVEGRPQRLSSTMEFKQNELIIHYLSELGDLDHQGNFKVVQTKKMDATFIFGNNQWASRDSAQLAKFDLWLGK